MGCDAEIGADNQLMHTEAFANHRLAFGQQHEAIVAVHAYDDMPTTMPLPASLGRVRV